MTERLISPLPDRSRTARLELSRATDLEREDLVELHLTSSYLEDWVGTPARPEDIDRSLHDPMLPPGGNKENFRFFSIYRRSPHRLVGLADVYHGYPEPSCFYLGYLYFHPDFQGEGYGREIVEFLVEHCRSCGFRAIRLGVHLKNWPALRFWFNNGFDRITLISGDKIHTTENFAVLELEKLL